MPGRQILPRADLSSVNALMTRVTPRKGHSTRNRTIGNMILVTAAIFTVQRI